MKSNNFLGIKNNFLLILAIFCGGLLINAQTKKPVSAQADEPPPLPAKTSKKIVKKTELDYFTLIEIDANSKIVVSLASKTNSPDFAETLFSVLNQKIASKTLNSTEIFIRPNPSLRYGEIADLIKKIRKSPNQNMKVEVADDLLAVVSKPLPKIPRPNPFFLLVKLEEGGKISLNNETTGSIKDSAQLKEFLRKIFKERAENGAFREGTNEVEQEVFISAPPTTKFGEIAKIAQALREAGATPIGLQIDEFIRTIQIQETDK